MALALARKYRPRRFSDLLVQDHVASVLRGAVVKNRVGHGYLLTGPCGVGKTTAARILAMALNCERKGQIVPAGEPCGECESCLRIWTGGAGLDVVEIDAASNRGVDDARELRERAMYAASREGHHKVYIVDEAHMLTREAWNALLKILEEPPPGVVFVFATTEPQKIAQTAAPVLSRLQRFDFRRIGAAAIRERLIAVLAAEQIEADEDALTLIARQADGGMRDALSVLDQCLSFGEGRVTAQRVREILGLVADEVYGELITLLVQQSPAGVFALVDRLEDAGADLIEFLGQAGEVLRAMLMLKLGTRPEGLTEALRQALERHLDQLEPGDLLRMLKVLAETEPSLRRTGNPRLGVETLLLRWTMMDRTVNLAQVLAGGDAGRPGGQAGGRSEGRSSPLPTSPAQAPGATGPIAHTAESPALSSRPAVEPAVRPPDRPTAPRIRGELTLESLAQAWPDLTQVARDQSRFLGEAVNAARPVGISGAEVKLALPDGNPIHLEALGHQRSAVERLLSEAAGRPITIAIARTGAESTSAAPRRRLSESEARAERLKVLKTRDPALEAAAEALDLEVLE
ncbi:MAG TPA: DNA polymerase III subunit gamma/tau [Gemmatimonadales bacterium]|nr:DNA polymerase III subunit gamma/tau [Gemmatimonadales bacterium]